MRAAGRRLFAAFGWRVAPSFTPPAPRSGFLNGTIPCVCASSPPPSSSVSPSPVARPASSPEPPSAVAGGLIGSQFGGGPGERLAAGLAGAAIGGLIGNAIGRDLDAQDRERAYAAERVVWVEGRRSEWRSEKAYGYVEPGRTYYRGAVYCREYTHTIYVGGRPQTAVGTASRHPARSWSQVG